MSSPASFRSVSGLQQRSATGESGNAVIAGHRDSFLRPLRNVRVGDDVFVDTRQGRFQYRVTSLRVVKPHDLSVLNRADEAVLTLITCYPFWVLGDAPDRFVVRAVAVGNAARAFTPAAPLPRESTGALPLKPPAAAESPAPNTPAVPDDEGLVRQALERFRRTYNARSISRTDVRPNGLLRFETCEVTVATDRATAACDVPVLPPADRDPQVWTLAFERAAGGWAIRSIAVGEAAR